MPIQPLSPLWKERSADVVETDAIRRHCYGLWPYTRPLMLKLAASQMVQLAFVPEIPICGFFDDLKLIPDRGDEAYVLGRCVHEIAESIICRGDYPELLRHGDARIPHQVACLVEQRFQRAYTFHHLQRESEHEDRMQREGVRWDLPPLVYAVDEWVESVVRKNRTTQRGRNPRRRVLK